MILNSVLKYIYIYIYKAKLFPPKGVDEDGGWDS